MLKLVPKISIVTPVYNGSAYIENCILSVATQTLNNIEHIVIDGKSTDGTIEVLLRYSQSFKHLKYLSEPDAGIYDAMNKGIRMSSGEYLLFLGSDDTLYTDNTLKEIFENIENANYDFLYGKVVLRSSRKEYGGYFDTRKLMKKNIPHQAIFYKRFLFDQLGYYGMEYKVCEDYLFNIKCFNDPKIKKKYIDVIVSVFNDSGLSSYYNDQFIKKRLFYFSKLNLFDKLLRTYFYYRPKWFRIT